MNNYFKIIFSLSVIVTLFSCAKDDNNPIAKPRDYKEQYAKDIDSIDKFIDTHSMTVDANYNVTFNEIVGDEPSIRDNPNLQFKTVTNISHEVDYKIYYIVLNPGVGERPTAVDSIHVSYKGVETVKGAQFDYAQNPVWFNTDELVAGWSEIMPYFRTGTYDTTEGPNPVTFSDYGAGVMFLPSGMGYYNTSQGTLSAYANLVFSFKLYELKYRDHDRDGILSKDEVEPGADFLFDPQDYDSDGDDVPNYFDVDDDNDRVLTKNEIKYTYMDGTVEKTRCYPFNGAATDDPSTPWDETRGIPRAFTGPLMPVIIPPSTTPIMLLSPGPGDFTDASRLRRHLNPNAKPPFYDQYQ
jgi:FKBP-type peptidyl-prolyl cis-trans isomerase FkpA